MNKILAQSINDNEVYIPRKRIMVFDVETTGLSITNRAYYNEPEPPLQLQPYILQMSFVIYETDTKQITKTRDMYIRINDEIEINTKITELTGIDRDICNNKGISIVEALDEFYEEYNKCDCIVAHNIDFDRSMLEIEKKRNDVTNTRYPNMFNEEYQKNTNKLLYCTMKVGRTICKLKSSNAQSNYYKPPKLAELFEYLFGKENLPLNLHNSLVDTFVCLKCFIKIKYNHNITIPNI